MNSILIILTIIGGVVSIGTIIIWINQRRKKLKEKISWKMVEKGVLKLKDNLLQKNYYPTLIIGIGRGGAVVGALLSGTLGNIPIIVLDRIYEWKNHVRNEDLFEKIKITKNIDKVLIVAGELHTGNTAKKYIEYFEQMGAKQTKMLAFMKEPYPTFKPDFFFIETDNSRLRFPWMITKDYKRDSKIDYNGK